eukprot:TRINITY_DN30975_c0_g1_i1.p1 TRINITY_DN30975_c0_g1~~TRINITY_DN30975_c0_g1_i1.p1  ORF type:complete len:142 (+),score=36.44 TRINITY_DN30975_c0_g1_i1:48-473(+)
MASAHAFDLSSMEPGAEQTEQKQVSGRAAKRLRCRENRKRAKAEARRMKELEEASDDSPSASSRSSSQDFDSLIRQVNEEMQLVVKRTFFEVESPVSTPTNLVLAAPHFELEEGLLQEREAYRQFRLHHVLASKTTLNIQL